MTNTEKQIVQGFLRNIQGLCERSSELGEEQTIKAIQAQVQSNLEFIKNYID